MTSNINYRNQISNPKSSRNIQSTRIIIVAVAISKCISHKFFEKVLRTTESHVALSIIQCNNQTHQTLSCGSWLESRILQLSDHTEVRKWIAINLKNGWLKLFTNCNKSHKNTKLINIDCGIYQIKYRLVWLLIAINLNMVIG